MILKKFFCLLLAVLTLVGCVFASAEPDTAEDDTVLQEDCTQDDALQEDAAPEDSNTPVIDSASEEPSFTPSWQTPGARDSEILHGGLYLYTDDGCYVSEGGIWYRSGTAETYICSDNASNLNLYDGSLYYTVGCEVRRIPAAGGTVQTVYAADGAIDELYVIGTELRWLSDGAVYSYCLDTGVLYTWDCPEGVIGLIPTEYGNLYLTGSAFSMTVWADSDPVLYNVESCYTDSDRIVVVSGGVTYQTEPADLFNGRTALSDYTLHSGEQTGTSLTESQELAAQAAYFSSDEYQQMLDMTEEHLDGAYTASNSRIAYTATSSGTLTTDQTNIVSRAKLMASLTWSPLKNLSWWTGTTADSVTASDGTITSGYYAAGKTYIGVPYSQPVYTNGYVGWGITLKEFQTQCRYSGSLLYSSASTYAGYTGPYYGIDCSGLVSFAWNLTTRRTVSHLRDSDVSVKISSSLYNLRVGDTLNRDSVHVLLITDLAYDSSGNLVSVEVTEQVPPKTRVCCYGELIPGRTYDYTGSLSVLAAYLTSYNYSIFRRNVSYSVSAYSDTGWVTVGNNRYYYDADGNALTGWQWIDGSWYYFGTDGKMAVGWLLAGTTWYYLGSDGRMLENRFSDDGNFYFVSGGAMVTGWRWIDSAWYYFDSNGYKQTGWLLYGTTWYYLDSDGKMLAGSFTPDGHYYLNADGIMVTGWQWIGSSWYYFNASGYMQTGWLLYGTTRYYLGSDGRMLSAAFTPDGHYYLTAGGAMATGWQWIGSGWYYFDGSGYMQTGWLLYGTTWYYLGSDGRMLENCWTPDGNYYLTSGGAMATGRMLLNNEYYYFGSSGWLYRSQWVYDYGWYYVNSSGYCIRSYTETVRVQKIGSSYYAFDNTGLMQTGWQSTDEARYYMSGSGEAYTSRWLTDGGYTYYFDTDGKMLANTTRVIDGISYTFDISGHLL